MNELGSRVKKECEAWARTFALELPLVEKAVEGYVAVLTNAADTAPSDVEIAKTLAKLRREVSKIIKDGEHAPERAKNLEELAEKLRRSIAHSETLEAAGLIPDLPDMRPRLEAARNLVIALRAAIARRARS